MIGMKRKAILPVLMTLAATVSLYAADGEGGVEAALVTYSDASLKFSIGYPGPWTRDPAFKGAVSFVGADDSLTLEFAKLEQGVTLKAFAEKDAAALATSIPGFKSLGLAPSRDIKAALILGFEASGKSMVTAKLYKAHDERYYIPLADGRIAILTMKGPARTYDREGFRDIALSFKAQK